MVVSSARGRARMSMSLCVVSMRDAVMAAIAQQHGCNTIRRRNYPLRAPPASKHHNARECAGSQPLASAWGLVPGASGRSGSKSGEMRTRRQGAGMRPANETPPEVVRGRSRSSEIGSTDLREGRSAVVAVEAGLRPLRAADRIAMHTRRFGAAVETESGVHRENPVESRKGRAARAAIGAHITPGIFGLQTFFSQLHDPGATACLRHFEDVHAAGRPHTGDAQKNRATEVALQSTTHRGRRIADRCRESRLKQ